jgi:FtsP/CotA-like multicopper oxidase with cupredoxin domain
VWPYLNVEPRRYRFRILDGSNARFYSLALSNLVTGTAGPAFRQIGTDGGYLDAPVLLNDPANPMSPRLLIAPGERADVVIDFSGYAPGTQFILRNTAKAPYPVGAAANPQTTGQVMLFRVVAPTGPDDSVIPPVLTSLTRLSNPTVTRTMTLNELMGAGGPLGMLLNGMPFMGTVTEKPTLGTTEMWEIVNLTADTHPMHLHLVQFQLLNRQKVDIKRYQAAFGTANPVIPTDSYVPVPVGPYLKGKPMPADPNERGWKDTFRMNPGEVSRILVKWAPQDDPAFTFDATAEPGYVWHCHILEHEENDMMRRFQMVAPAVQAAQGRLAPASPEIASTTLGRAYPNPTRDGAKVRFTLRAEGQASLEIFNVAGQRVRTLARGTFGAGEHILSWDGADEQGRALGAGVYFVRFQGDGTSRNQKLLVTR